MDEPLASGTKAGHVGKVTVDRVRYDDGIHGDALFPVSADGGGDALHRLGLTTYGNRPDNWTAGAPSPGSAEGGGGGNQHPTITDGPSADPNPVSGNTTTLSVTASDPDGDPLSYFWSVASQPAGSSPAVGNGATTEVTFDKAGTYEFQVSVIDDQGGQDTGTVAVTVQQLPGGVIVNP